MRSILPLSLLLLSGLLPAQNCGTLSSTGGAAGTTLAINVAGAPANGFAVLVVGQNAGSTTVPLPMGGSLVLGIDSPILPLPLGRTDANGAVSLSVDIPAGLTQQFTVQAQAAVLTYTLMPFALNACAGNVIPITIG
jgi:hypothetical protein